MTDRHKGYIVHLDDDIRDDDAGVISALRMIRGVADVTPVTGDYEADVIAVRRRDKQWQIALTVLRDDGPGEIILRSGRQAES